MSIRSILFGMANEKTRKDLEVQEKQNTEIRDSLAMERTKLANERTFLAYMRTAMALVLAGLTLIRFFEGTLYMGLGALAIVSGVGVALFGYRRFTKKQEAITHHTTAYTPTSPMHAEVMAQERAGTTPPS
ncbi:DUF202 domain-containing protein [Pontibacter sp. E15-1]|uniref:YidH family protein n=1 Tax=Pontibacter sp. E15-1 TaxID=2919918 RepID=UPI001F4F63C8|nr:DUF202 domain-containing protein [Pontibacter sp. E15-1]MCJ8165392.1 DUF202 domain-containing protein [Pontibacter sp. E15-1]